MHNTTSFNLHPTAVSVAQTVGQYCSVFCSLYPINTQDTNAGVPGILFGRYEADTYGGGNPWQLITAALASLLYQAAQECAAFGLSADELSAWQSALGTSFAGTRDAFIAAGDSVLLRLKHHIQTSGNEELHVYEQIDKNTGEQYNAEDLTWSYAEILGALGERAAAYQ